MTSFRARVNLDGFLRLVSSFKLFNPSPSRANVIHSFFHLDESCPVASDARGLDTEGTLDVLFNPDILRDACPRRCEFYMFIGMVCRLQPFRSNCYTELRANLMTDCSRIFYRIWQIYQKPVEELVDLLGIEIPPVPQVSLAGITAESILLYWKPTDLQSVTLRYVIQVNGIKGKCLGRGCLRVVGKLTESSSPR